MKIQWMILAEGFGQDSKGAITAIGLNQNVLVADKLPQQTKRGVLVRFLDEDAVAFQGNVSLTFTVRAPSGKVISANTGTITVGPKKIPKLPGTGEIPAEFGLIVEEYGRFVISVEVSRDGHPSETAEEYLYVVEPSEVAEPA